MTLYPHTRTIPTSDISDDKPSASAITGTLLYGPKPIILTMKCCGAVYNIPRWRGVDYVPPHECSADDDGRVDSPALRAQRQQRQRTLTLAADAANGASTLSKLSSLLPVGTPFIYPATDTATAPSGPIRSKRRARCQ